MQAALQAELHASFATIALAIAALALLALDSLIALPVGWVFCVCCEGAGATTSPGSVTYI